jgi:hypothetical protein
MKKTDVHLGATYLVKVAGNLVPVRIDREHDNGGWLGTSQKTGKSIRIKSPQRLRKRLGNVPDTTDEPAKASKDAKAEPKRDTGERDATGAEREAKPMSLLNAAAHLLSLGTGDPMRCKDIVDLAIQRGLWAPRNGGKTPANTLSAALRREIKAKGDASRFRLADRGKFELNR